MIASSAEEAALLLERFRQIALDFLRISVLDGGWLELAALPLASPESAPAASPVAVGSRPPGSHRSCTHVSSAAAGRRRPSVPERSNRITRARGIGEGHGLHGHDGRPERPFFERLGDWFGAMPMSPESERGGQSIRSSSSLQLRLDERLHRTPCRSGRRPRS
jgi:hypothetical protein